MKHRVLAFAATAVAAAGLCAGLATTALASSGGSTGIKQAQVAVKQTVQSKPVSDAPAATSVTQSAKAASGPDAATLAAQVSYQTQRLENLKAQGQASAAQLAWLAMTPAQKTADIAALDTGWKPIG